MFFIINIKTQGVFFQRTFSGLYLMMFFYIKYSFFIKYFSKHYICKIKIYIFCSTFVPRIRTYIWSTAAIKNKYFYMTLTTSIIADPHLAPKLTFFSNRILRQSSSVSNRHGVFYFISTTQLTGNCRSTSGGSSSCVLN